MSECESCGEEYDEGNAGLPGLCPVCEEIADDEQELEMGMTASASTSPVLIPLGVTDRTRYPWETEEEFRRPDPTPNRAARRKK